MRRPFSCHCMVHVRHAVHFAGARARHLYPSPAGSWMIPVIASQIVRARGVLWLILPFQLEPHFCQFALSS
jgi:hypothetical protein